MSQLPTLRHRGGQPGNTNRLTHGLYSSRFHARLRPQASGNSLDLDFEIVFARMRLRALLKKQQLCASPREWLSYERAVLHYVSLISSLLQERVLRTPVHAQLIRLAKVVGVELSGDWGGGGTDSILNRTAPEPPAITPD